MRLPELLLLTNSAQLPPGRTLLEQVDRCVDAGLRGVVLRERHLEDRERAELAYDVEKLLAPVGGSLLVAAPSLGHPAGVHLRAHDRKPHPRPVLLGRSCHDADGLRRAAEEGMDHVTLGPFAATDSKPGYGPPLGAAGFRETVAVLDALPRRPRVYALGGISADNARAALDAGADGIAVMGVLMRAEDPAHVVLALHRAMAHQPENPTEGVS